MGNSNDSKEKNKKEKLSVPRWFSRNNEFKDSEAKKCKIKSMLPQKIGRAVFWILIAFFCLRGAASVIRGSSKIDVDKKVSTILSTNDKNIKFAEEGAAFAQSFAVEYMTYKQGQTEDYQKRLSNYVSPALININIQGSDVEALNATVIKKELYSKNQLNVDIRVRAKYSNKDKIKDIFIRVPVTQSDGKYIVEDLPLIIPSGDLAKVEAKGFEGVSLSDDETSKMKTTLESFIKVYCEGTTNEINYYMSNTETKINGLKGSFKFKAIDDIRAYKGEDDSNNFVIVNFTITDVESLQDIKQRAQIKIIKKDGRYYIVSFDARTVNLIDSGRYKK